MEPQPGAGTKHWEQQMSYNALGAADVFSGRQSPGQCPTCSNGFPDWALPSAVRSWGQNSEPETPSSLAGSPREMNPC